jgi:hypothetical protein
MKKYLLILLYSVLLLTGCAKDDSTPPGSVSTPLTGQWSLVKDSIFYDYTGPTPSNFSPDSVYIGNKNDYWDFNANGELRIKEGGSIDSARYKSYAYNLVLIDSFGININGTYLIDSVTTLTADHIIIHTPGGGYFRMVELTK